MARFESSFAAFVISRKLFLIAFSLTLVTCMSVGLNNLYFDSSYRVFFSEKNPELLAFEALENTYTKDDNVIMVLTPETGTIFQQDNLAAIKQLTTSAWQMPYSNRVDSLSNFQYSRSVGDDLIVTDLVNDTGSLTDKEIQLIKQVSISGPPSFPENDPGNENNLSKEPNSGRES